MTMRFSSTNAFWGAHALCSLASASRDRELSFWQPKAGAQFSDKRLFRRDAETNRRDAYAPQNTLHT